VTHFVVKVENDAVSFAAYLGETAVKFVVKTAEQVYKLVTWVFHKIQVAFEELVTWLGYLFAWKDIWRTHKVIAAMARNGLDYLSARADGEIANWERRVDEFFEHLGSVSKSIELPPDLAAKRLSPASGGGVAQGVRSALKSPIGNWSFYQLQHGGLSGSDDSRAPNTGGSSSEHASLLDELKHALGASLHDLQHAIVAFASAVRSGSVTLADLARLAEAPLVAALEPLRPLAKKAFELVRTLLRTARATLDAELPVPFLGTLYKWLTTLLGDEEELTFINGVALLIAIPLTIVSKVAGHGAPFDGPEGHALGQTDTFDRLFGPRSAVAADVERRALAPLAAAADGGGHGFLYGYAKWGGFIASMAGLFSPIVRGIKTLKTLSTKPAPSGSDEEWIPLLPKNGSPDEDASASLQRSRASVGRLFTFDKLLLGIGLVLDGIQFVTTVPVPQEDVPGGVYGFRLGAYLVRLLGLAISYPAQWFGWVDEQAAGGLLFVVDFVAIGATLAANSMVHEKIRIEQWLGDSLSNAGGLLQGIGEFIAVVAQADDEPASDAWAIFWTAISGGSGFAFAETGAGIYAHLALSADGGIIFFTSPGG
jgi:hypothetical protein